MAHDWAADVSKYVPRANEAAIARVLINGTRYKPA
jgi:hypothetical protein